ncbi:hypothetical protein GGR57DRAFT_499963 [Xylariaceae sp. FL1272]|nr:hypothetical protein GGR57DRAFT_499963 [Xylariaceae sp. FL1272]
MKASILASALALASSAVAYPKQRRTKNEDLPTTVVANITVVDTQLVRDVRAEVEMFKELQPYLYYHVMRTWLFGAAAFNFNETLKSQVDLELHAIGTLMHDLGWDMRPDSPWVTQENRFEVDGGLGAMSFIKSHGCVSEWDDARLEKIYDGIVLQAIPGVVEHKNIDSQWIVMSVGFEFPGPHSPLIPDHDYDTILAEFPNDKLYRGSNATFTWMTATKSAATYNTFLAPFGYNFVPGYNEAPNRLYDYIQMGLQMELAAHPNSTFP